jgi:hypothetical protein
MELGDNKSTKSAARTAARHLPQMEASVLPRGGANGIRGNNGTKSAFADGCPASGRKIELRRFR